jgi:inhibitor of cysteine peptidase
MTSARRLVLVALAALALLAATAAPGLAATAHVFRLNAGDTLVVRLPTNPSTGYHWVVTHAPSRFAKVGRITSSRDVAPPAGSNPGTPGERVMRVKALAPGRTRLELAYVGPGTSATVAQTYRVLMIVR